MWAAKAKISLRIPDQGLRRRLPNQPLQQIDRRESRIILYGCIGRQGPSLLKYGMKVPLSQVTHQMSAYFVQCPKKPTRLYITRFAKGTRIMMIMLLLLLQLLLLLCITKTRLYNFDPLKPDFYIVKLGFTGVYIIFLTLLKKHRLWVLVRTASIRRF